MYSRNKGIRAIVEAIKNKDPVECGYEYGAVFNKNTGEVSRNQNKLKNFGWRWITEDWYPVYDDANNYLGYIASNVFVNMAYHILENGVHGIPEDCRQIHKFEFYQGTWTIHKNIDIPVKLIKKVSEGPIDYEIQTEGMIIWISKNSESFLVEVKK
jgi:hypothetical protein